MFYICLSCGQFHQGDEERRIVNRCEDCEEEHSYV
jgi:DNA-directed RNA polymerase subunit RPC12/RpoP